MALHALFAGLVVDEYDRPVEVGTVGGEPCYVINDQGLRRHIPSEQVDRQVLASLALAARKAGPPGSTAKGIAIAEGLLRRSGLKRGTYRMENGSGLFGNQRFSPKQLVLLLERLPAAGLLKDDAEMLQRVKKLIK